MNDAQMRDPSGPSSPSPAAALSTITRDDLVAGLHARGVCYLAPTPHGDEKPLSDAQLVAGMAQAEDARLRFALAALLLMHPEVAALVPAVDVALADRPAARDELRKHTVAAMYLQRLWRTHLRLQFGETPLLPELFNREMGLPAPDIMHGEMGLRMLCDRSAYNDWSSYQQIIDLLGNQPCAGQDVLSSSTSQGDNAAH
jgi:hypothetical protein